MSTCTLSFSGMPDIHLFEDTPEVTSFRSKKSPLKIFTYVFEKYTLVVGIPKKINTLAKEVFSLFNRTKNYRQIEFGFKGISIGFIIFGAPIHVYNIYNDFHKSVSAVYKLNVVKFVEFGLRFVVDLADIGDDVSSAATLLSTFGIVSQTAIAWAGPLGAVSGAFQSLGLISSGIDYYRVNRFQKGFREATGEGKTYSDLITFLDENRSLTKKVMGMKPKELLKVLRAKEAVADRNEATDLVRGKVGNKIWVARAALMKSQHKELIKLLNNRTQAQIWTTRLALVAGVIAVVAAGILILSPILFPLAAPTLASIGTGFLLSTTTVFVGKFFVEKVVDLKFRRDIYKNKECGISPIIITNPVTKEDVEIVHGTSTEYAEQTIPNVIPEYSKNQQINQEELKEAIRKNMLLRELY